MIVRLLFALLLVCGGGRLPAAADDPPADEIIQQAEALRKQALAHHRGRRFEDALRVYQKVVALLRTKERDLPELANVLNDMAFTLHTMGRHREALPRFQESLAMRRRLFGGDHERIAASLGNVAAMLRAAGRAQDALALHEEALAMSRRLFSGDHPVVARQLSNLAGTLDALGRREQALELLEESLAMTRRLKTGDQADVLLLLGNVGGTLTELGRLEQALPPLEEALAMARRLHPGDHPNVARALNNLAQAHQARGRPADALALQEQALAMTRRLTPGDHPAVARYLNNLAGTLNALGRAEASLALLQESLAMRRRLYRGDHPEVAASLNNVALALGSLGRHRDALPLRKEVVAMFRRALPGDHPSTALSLSNLAGTLKALGRPHEALPVAREALAMRRRLHTDDHPEVVRATGTLGNILARLGRPTQALGHFEEALAMARRLFPGDHPEVARGLGNLGSLWVRLGQAQRGVRFREEALEMSRRLFLGDHPFVARQLASLASARSALEQPADARPMYEEALAMAERLFPDGHPLVASCLNGWAVAAGALGRPEDALAPLQRVWALNRALYGDEHPEVARARSNLAGALLELGRDQEAVQHAQAAIELGKATHWADTYVPRLFLGSLWVRRQRPDEAIRVMTPAIDVLAVRRRQAAPLGTEGRTHYLATLRQSELFPLLMRAHLQRGDTAAALGVLEQGRGREVLDLLERGRHGAAARARAARDPVLQARLVEADQAVRDAESAIATAQARQDASTLRAVRLEARRATRRGRAARARALRARLSVLQDALPETRPLDAAQMQAILRKGERILAYGLHEPSFVFVVSSTAIDAYRLGTSGKAVTRDGLAAAVGDYLARLSKPGEARSSEGLASGKALFATLVPPKVWDAVRSATQLFILPHGALHRLPFEALVVEHAQGQPVYWADRGPPVAYAPSASVLAGLRARGKGPAKPVRFVAVADPVFDASWVPLPATRVEVQRVVGVVREALPTAQVTTMMGAQATEAALFAAADAPTYLHLATHGAVDPSQPAREAALILTRPADPTPDDDGLLTFGDLIERWQGRLEGTQMAVLSACDTQTGDIDESEGVLSLPWAFCFAGARSAVASLWQVDDQSTSALMAAMYERLLRSKDATPCDALHAARREVKAKRPDPYHWAPFVFVGAP